MVSKSIGVIINEKIETNSYLLHPGAKHLKLTRFTSESCVFYSESDNFVLTKKVITKFKGLQVSGHS